MTETAVPSDDRAGRSGRPTRDEPWVMRTYAGHSSAVGSNALFRRNLAKGQTGLSVAFDLPTQTGYDPDSALARGEVGKVGVPVPHLGEMRRLFADIPLTATNTSMTINATAMWLLALYQVVAEEQNPGLDPEVVHGLLAGTTQNDIIKEYLSRGTYVFPPEQSLRLTTDTIAYTVAHVPRWNPINICSYHLQEAGATPVQEIAYALCTAIAVLDAVRDSGQVAPEDLGRVVGRISFFVNAGVRFVEETCKMRAFVQLWDTLTRERYAVEDETMRRFRYGVQVNSLGLTEAQPENNVQRIVLEMLGVTLSKGARARAVQLPAWNEALGLPRPWDQQWSLRLQQVLAFESDLLEHGDIFDGSHVIEAKVAELVAGAQEEIDRVQAMGGAVAAVESGYMKQALVSSHAARRARIEQGAEVVVGVNRYQTTEESPLTADLDAAIQVADPRAEHSAVEELQRWRAARDQAAVDSALQRLAADAAGGVNLMDATLAAARAGVTTGEWAGTLRAVFGEYRAPTGVSGGDRRGRGGRGPCRGPGGRPADRGGAGGPAAAAGGQARPRRPLQRRRAGRRACPRRRLRGRLPGDPADARADRRRSGRRGRALRGPLDPVRLAHGAGAQRAGGAEGRGHGRRAGDCRRHHPGLGRGSVGGPRRGRGLHPEGLRADRHHGRHRGDDPRCARSRRLSAAPRLTGTLVPMSRVIVVGAGVVGLSCAVRLLEKGHSVGVVARDLPLETTSAVAGAFWYPYRAYPFERVTAWAATTYAELARLAAGDPGGERTGVVMRAGTELLRAPQPSPWWASAVPSVTPASQVPPGYAAGWEVEVPVAEMPVYLAWLAGRVAELGGTVTRMALPALPAHAEVVVNASGLGSRLLGEDGSVVPVRGQVVLVSQVGLDRWWLDGAAMTSVVPRRHDIVCGGTDEEGSWSRTPDPEITQAILGRARALVPELAGARVLGHRVGLRPARPSVRLEALDLPGGGQLVHCYGHGGAGVTLSWGCADEVAALVR